MKVLALALFAVGAVGAVGALAAPAHADRDFCPRGAVHRGPAIDLDLKAADLHDVFRLLSDVGRVNLVVSDDVQGKVTLRLKRVAWGQAACTVAAVHRLEIRIRGDARPDTRPILLVRKRASVQHPARGSRRLGDDRRQSRFIGNDPTNEVRAPALY